MQFDYDFGYLDIDGTTNTKISSMSGPEVLDWIFFLSATFLCADSTTTPAMLIYLLQQVEVGHGKKAIVIFVPVPLLQGFHKIQQR